MSVQWTPDLSVGVVEIDLQHQELLVRVNDFLAAAAQGESKDEVRDAINFLGNYAIRHSTAEEKYMLRLCYPDYEAHEKQHEAFLQWFTTLKAQFEESGPTAALIAQANGRVADWLAHHIPKSDTALGKFIHAKSSAT